MILFICFFYEIEIKCWWSSLAYGILTTGCAGTFLAGIVIILILYASDIVLLERDPSDLDKQLRLLKDFFSTLGMTANTDKTKVMIIKSKKYTYANFVYENRNLE